MKNLSKKNLFFALFGTLIVISGGMAIKAMETTDEVFEQDTPTAQLIPPRFIGGPVELRFKLPIIGEIVLRGIKGANGREGMEGAFKFPANPIVIGPLTIDNQGSIRLINGALSFTGKAELDLWGKKLKAEVGLRELAFEPKQDTETEGSEDTPTKRTRVVESCKLGIKLKGRAQELELIPGVPFAFKSADLVLTSLLAPSLHIRGFLGRARFDLLATLNLKNKSISAQGAIRQCKLIQLAPFLKNTIFENFSFGGKFSISTSGDAHAEGHLYGKTLKDKASVEFFPGVSASFDSIIFDFKKDDATSIIAKTTFLGASFEYTGKYNIKNKELSLSADMKQLKLVSLLPFVKDTEIQDIVFNANARISSKKSVSFKGGLSNESKKSFYGLTLKKIEVGLDTGKKFGYVTGAIDMVGLPASANFLLNWGAKGGIFVSAGFDETIEEWQPFSLLPKVSDNLEFIRLLSIYKPILRLSAGVAKEDIIKTKKRLEGLAKKKTATEKKPEQKTPKKEELSPEKKTPKKEELSPTKEGPSPKKLTEEEKENRKLDELEDEVADATPLDSLKAAGTHISLTIGGTIKAGKLVGEAARQIAHIANLKKELIDLIATKDIDVEGLFKIGLSKGGKFNVVGLLGLPKGFGLTDLLPKKEQFEKAMPGKGGILYEVLDLVRLDYGKVVVCLTEEEIEGVKYSTGISVDTNISVGQNLQQQILKSLTFAKMFFDKKGDRGVGARFFVTFNPLSPKELVLKIGLTTGDFTFTIPKVDKPPVQIGPFDFSNLVLDFVIRGMSLGVDCSFDFLPHEDPDQQKITFSVGMKASDTAIAGEASAAGMWSNPFGIAKIFRGGFKIGNLGGFISETYENIGNIIDTFGASLLLGHIGLSGKINLGATKPLVLEGFLKVGGDLMDTAFEFRAKNIEKIADLMQGFLEQLGLATQIKVDLNKLVPGKIQEIFLKFAPFGSNIGNIRIESGIGGAFYGELFGAPVGAELIAKATGISLRGYLPDIKVGPLVITKAGGKGVEIQELIKNYFKTGAPGQIGPEFHFVLALDQLPKFKANGELRVDLPNTNEVLFKSLVDIELSSERIAFETDAQVGPSWAGLRACIKGTTLEISDPMKLLTQLQPDKLSLEMEFTNTLSKKLLDAMDAMCAKLANEIDKTYKELSAQVDRATTDADVDGQEQAFKKATEEKRIDDSIIAWIKWKFLAAKRDLEKALDPTGGMREFMKAIGMNKLIQAVLGGIADELSILLKGGKLSFDAIAKSVIINKVYWKGTVAGLTKGIIPGIEIDVDIRNKNFHKNIGDLDFSTKDKLTWSLAQISLNTGQLVALFFSELFGIGLNIPACAPSVLIEFQNQREDLEISVVDSNKAETVIPWKDKRPYVQTDILCQKRPDQLKPKEPADAISTFTLKANGHDVADINCAYGPLGTEGIVARIKEITDNGTLVERMVQVNWGEKYIDLAPKGIAPFTLKVQIIREGIQSKIKFYIQELFENCGAKVYVEAVNQIPNIKVVVSDDKFKKITIPHTSQRAWIRVDGMCRNDTQPVSKKYTVSVQGKDVAYVNCVFGPANNEFMEATITKAPGVKSSVTAVSRRTFGTLTLPFKIPDMGRLLLKVELVKETTAGVYQSKFKIYIQELKECGAQAWVEVQNQVYGADITVEDAYEKRVTIPSWDKQNYVTLDPICQSRAEVAEPLSIYLEGKKVAEVICSFGPEENETVRAKIIRFGPDGNPIGEVVGKNYERIEMPLTA